MADTISDVILSGNAYEDLYAASGITPGLALIIQNKSNGRLWVQIAATQPSAGSRDGYMVKADPRFPIKVEAGEAGVWGFGRGHISVQEG